MKISDSEQNPEKKFCTFCLKNSNEKIPLKKIVLYQIDLEDTKVKCKKCNSTLNIIKWGNHICTKKTEGIIHKPILPDYNPRYDQEPLYSGYDFEDLKLIHMVQDV